MAAVVVIVAVIEIVERLCGGGGRLHDRAGEPAGAMDDGDGDMI